MAKQTKIHIAAQASEFSHLFTEALDQLPAHKLKDMLRSCGLGIPKYKYDMIYRLMCHSLSHPLPFQLHITLS
jgi:hypothetical protein